MVVLYVFVLSVRKTTPFCNSLICSMHSHFSIAKETILCSRKSHSDAAYIAFFLPDIKYGLNLISKCILIYIYGINCIIVYKKLLKTLF